jgi:hypothetical protein
LHRVAGRAIENAGMHSGLTHSTQTVGFVQLAFCARIPDPPVKSSPVTAHRKGSRVKNWLLILLAGFIALLPCVGSATPIAPDGKQLVAMLDAMNVEHLWLAGEHIDWQSGAPTGKPERVEGKHTHCSAFVASVAERLGLYILCPPEHTQMLLANAQFDWLVDQGAAGGWNELTSSEQAQADANRGGLVVAVYRNHHDDKPGHIAIVRPNEKSASAIADEGPQVTQAGGTNYASTSLAQGFANHPAAWGHKEVRYFAHIVDWKNAHALH